MKVFNFGSDYAYQQKQKSQPEETAAQKDIDNVANQIQTGGEGEADPAPETTKNPRTKSKKKKENREETEEDCQDNGKVL